MTVLVYNKDDVLTRLENLPHEKRLAFAAACCERLVGNYVAFKSDTGWGDQSALQNAIARIWSCSVGAAIAPDEVHQLTEACESVAPDADHFESLFTASAQDAVFAVCSILDYLQDRDIAKLGQCSSYPVDSVDLYVQETENLAANASDLEERIREHRLMQQEIKRQYTDLSLLESGGSVDELRHRASRR